MSILANGVPALAEGTRNLKALIAHLDPVLRAVVAGESDVSALARTVRISEEDCRRALFLLEELGLVRSTRYVATGDGRREVSR